MGNTFGKHKEIKMIMQGLGGSGKTTILYRLKLGTISTISIPTIGFNVETVIFNNERFTIWDLGSGEKMQSLYGHYYPETQVLIVVVDSTDTERMDEVKYELHKSLQEEHLREVLVVILANKQDLSNAQSIDSIVQRLEFDRVEQKCNIFGTCGVTGVGLYEALGWVSDVLNGTLLNTVNKN